jgi:hypothetical protein
MTQPPYQPPPYGPPPNVNVYQRKGNGCWIAVLILLILFVIGTIITMFAFGLFAAMFA